MIINFYEMTVENSKHDEVVGAAHGTNPLECIQQLKTLLKHRVLKIHSIKSTVRIVLNVLLSSFILCLLVLLG